MSESNGKMLRWAGFLFTLAVAFAAAFVWVGKVSATQNGQGQDLREMQTLIRQVAGDLHEIKGYLKRASEGDEK